MSDPRHSTEYMLGEISTKLDDIHQMVHRQDEKMVDAIKELHAKNAKQDAHIHSLITWRARVRGMFAVVVAIPAVIYTMVKALGIKVLGL